MEDNEKRKANETNEEPPPVALTGAGTLAPKYEASEKKNNATGLKPGESDGERGATLAPPPPRPSPPPAAPDNPAPDPPPPDPSPPDPPTPPSE
jgi:hypothetical protein